MDFRILGPVQIDAASGAVALPSGKQVALLCRLLINRNEIVSRDRLIDALWGERPPPSAANGLQVHIHALRRLLGADRIALDGSGYRVSVEPGELDAERFETLAARGRSKLAEGDARAAAADLCDALRQWRGPAYEDVRYEDFAQVEADRLQELRLAALEDRIDADLALGADRELVPELESLVAEHRDRERLCAQLMLALYRSERHQAALEAFSSAREVMRDELGLEPGPALQELQQAILRHDATLTLEPAGSQASRLPAPETPLVGRSTEIEEIAKLIRGSVRLVTLIGAGGIGKTRLALGVGEELLGDFADGAYFVDLSHIVHPDSAPDAIAAALEIPAQRRESPDAAAQAFLAERQVLLLLDNFEAIDAAAPRVSELLRAAPALVVVATSRTPLRLSGEHLYRVAPLSPSDARGLFIARARAVAPSFRLPEEESDEVAQLCDRLDCLPLAIELAAARTRDYALGELLESVPDTLALTGEGGRDLPSRQRTLRATIDWSYQLLGEEERALFVRLAVFAGGFTEPDISAVCEAGHQTLVGLVDASLVQERAGTDGVTPYFMLETVRDFALELLAESGEMETWSRRHAEHYAREAEAVEEAQPASHSAEVWQMLEAEQDNFRAALDWARDSGEAELQLRLVGALAYFWATSDHLREGRARIDEALRSTATVATPIRAKALAGSAHVAHSSGDYERMRISAEASLDRYRDLGDEPRTAVALNLLGIALSNLGDIDGGIACHEENAAISRRLDDGVRLTGALNNLGYCLLQRGEPERARALFEEGLAVCRSIDHRAAESTVLGNLGLTAVLEEDPEAALGFFREAMLIDRQMAYPEGMIYGVLGIAATLAVAEDEEAATLLGAASAAAAAVAVEFEPLELDLSRKAHERMSALIGAERFAELRAAGEDLSLEDAVERGLRASVSKPGEASAAAP